jgi:gibberellin A4 carboxyl methyltransferase
MTVNRPDQANKATPHSSTTGMIGGGFYNANSAPQMAAIAAVLPWIDEAVAAMSLPVSAPAFTIADFGCSEGRNSIEVARHTIAALREKSGQAVQTIHSDLPTNDFSTLTRTLRSNAQSVFGDKSTYSSVVPGSMFDQLMPAGSLDFSMTFNAIGFLSRRPIESLPDYILPNGPSRARGRGSVSDADRTAFALQAKEDVASFLSNRAEELRPGGKVLLQVFGGDGEARTCDGLYDLLNDAVIEHVDEGKVPVETYRSYYQPVYFRTLEELVAPLKDSDSLAGQLKLDRAESYEVPVPFVEAYKADGDLDRYAISYVDFFRAFTEAVLRLALGTRPDLDEVVESIYSRAEVLLKANPDLYPFRYVAVAALLTKMG